MAKNKKGLVILPYCEMCAGIGIRRKLTDFEKENYGHECQECRDHLKDMLTRAFARNERERSAFKKGSCI